VPKSRVLSELHDIISQKDRVHHTHNYVDFRSKMADVGAKQQLLRIRPDSASELSVCDANFRLPVTGDAELA
jgi:hypothetical protein